MNKFVTLHEDNGSKIVVNFDMVVAFIPNFNGNIKCTRLQFSSGQLQNVQESQEEIFSLLHCQSNMPKYVEK